MFLQFLIRFSAEIISILSTTKSYIFLTTVLDNEEVYHLAICGTGRDLVLGEELCNYLQITPQLIIVSSSYIYHSALAWGERGSTAASLAFTLTLCML